MVTRSSNRSSSSKVWKIDPVEGDSFLIVVEPVPVTSQDQSIDSSSCSLKEYLQSNNLESDHSILEDSDSPVSTDHLEFDRDQSFSSDLDGEFQYFEKNDTVLSGNHSNDNNHQQPVGYFICMKSSISCLPDVNSVKNRSLGESHNLKFRTRLCEKYKQGYCLKNGRCNFAHSLFELKATKEYYKTRICRFWQNSECVAGDSCRHAHGEEDIRCSQNILRLSPKTRSNTTTYNSDISTAAGDSQTTLFRPSSLEYPHRYKNHLVQFRHSTNFPVPQYTKNISYHTSPPHQLMWFRTNDPQQG